MDQKEDESKDMTKLSDSTSKESDRSFEVVGMDKLVPSIRSRRYKGILIKIFNIITRQLIAANNTFAQA